MSHNNFTKKALHLQDENIFFSENCLKTESIKGVLTDIYSCSLTYEPQACPHCSSKLLIKYGFKEVDLKLPKNAGYNVILRINKQRFFCKTCKKTHSATTKLSSKKARISNALKQEILTKLVNLYSIKSIANEFNISHNTVTRITLGLKNKYFPNKNFLPKSLCFDEFKSVKECSGAMSFIFCDADTHKIIDIVEDRRKHSLKLYFESYSKKARASVEHIVVDMYTPYIFLIKELFPNAKISIDRFHLVQLINRAFNGIRIAIMKKYKSKEEPIYNKLKHYWKLLLKDSYNLKEVATYHNLFKRHISEKTIVDELLKINEELEKGYCIYQNILYGINSKNLDYLKNTLNESKKGNSQKIATALKTLRKYLPEIENSLTYSYSNGPLEGINNKIKTLKRVSFGYRLFENFKIRILLTNRIIAV